MNNKNKQKVYGKRAPLISLCIGVLALLCFLILLSQKIDHLLCFGISLAIIIIGNVIYTIYLRHKNKNGNEKLTHSLGQIMLEIVIKMQYPMVICDTTGKIIWRNRAFGQVTEKIGSVMGVGIGAISSINHEELTDGLPFSAELCERRYEI